MALTRFHWVVICGYAFLSFFSPSEAFLYNYFIEVKKFSPAVLNNEVYPYWTYALFLSLPLILPCVWALKSKRVIVLGAICRVAAGAIVIWVPPGLVWLLRMTQWTFGFFFACTQVVFPMYVFELMPSEEFQRGTAITRSAVLLACGTSAVAGQALMSFGVSTALQTYMTLCAHSLALVCAFALPLAEQTAKLDFRALVEVFRKRPSAQFILLWLVAASASQELMLTYYQAIFKESLPEVNARYNAGVLFAAYALGTFASMLPARASVEMRLRGSTHWLAPATCASGAALLALLGESALRPLTTADTLVYSYFVLAHATFEFVRTLCTAQLAVLMFQDSCRQYLAMLMLRQLAISSLQVILQKALKEFSADVGEQSIALAKFLGSVAILLGVISCIWPRSGALEAAKSREHRTCLLA